MSFRCFPPGSRKGNRFYIARGTIAGERFEVSTNTTDPIAAESFRARFELEVLQNRAPRAGEDITFGRGIDLYSDYRDPSKADRGRLARLKARLGDRLLRELGHADFVRAANEAHPAGAAATKNRETLRPAATVLHYCAGLGLCAWLRLPLFKERRPATRAVGEDVARILVNSISAATAPANLTPAARAKAVERHRMKRLFLLWIFRQGTRISDTLKIEWERIDLRARTVTYHVGKGDRPDVVKPLHDEIWEMLAQNPRDRGRVFPWQTKSGVYKWLRPYALGLGVRFTPHMARHSLGKWLNEEGASLRAIMDALDHADIKSSARYQSTDVEVLRAHGRRLGKLVSE